MDTARFLDELDTAFAGDVQRGQVRDERLTALARDVPGFTTPAELAVLSVAARVLPEDEIYLEVGTFKGRSICAAMMDSPDRDFVAVENFQEFGMVGRQAREALSRHLQERDLDTRLRLLDGDCFEVLTRKHLLDRPVGVYFYDGAHTGLAHWLALAVAEPLLADEAVVLVDDASWPIVRRATDRYVAAHEGWEYVLDLAASHQDDPVWANGLLVLRFSRKSGSVLGAHARILRRFQVHVRSPATSLVWHSLHRFPWLVPVAKRLVPKKSRHVTSADRHVVVGR